MNIFYLDNNPKVCAEMHNDKHCIKMILEYAQLLSTAHRVLDGVQSNGFGKTGRKQIRYVLSDSRESILYTATHINHPSAIWVRQSRDNYAWLWNLLKALCKEYTYRYGKVHKVEREGLLWELWYIPAKIAEHPTFTEPTPAMPDEVKVAGNSMASYRNYYLQRKNHLANWSGKINSRNVPEWFINENIYNI
jgi:hypothetical protein